MSLEYAGYLALVLVGALAFAGIAKLSFSSIQRRAIIYAIFCTAILFAAWDVVAVAKGHWTFGTEHMLGLFVLNQPIEELGFFLIIPFFGIILYALAQKWVRE